MKDARNQHPSCLGHHVTVITVTIGCIGVMRVNGKSAEGRGPADFNQFGDKAGEINTFQKLYGMVTQKGKKIRNKEKKIGKRKEAKNSNQQQSGQRTTE